MNHIYKTPDPCLSCGGGHLTCFNCYSKMVDANFAGNDDKREFGPTLLHICPRNFKVMTVLMGLK